MIEDNTVQQVLKMLNANRWKESQYLSKCYVYSFKDNILLPKYVPISLNINQSDESSQYQIQKLFGNSNEYMFMINLMSEYILDYLVVDIDEIYSAQGVPQLNYKDKYTNDLYITKNTKVENVK